MKKQFLIISGFAIITSALIFSCAKKKDNGAITPTYKEEATGTGGNPNVGNQTVTGTNTVTNPATQNSQLQVGGSGWSNPTCSSTFSTTLKGINGAIDITLTFAFPPTTGSYAIAASPNASSCSMVVSNAPNQPAGIVWYGKTGSVAVTTTSNGISASFTGILCTQQNFNFPTVGVSGSLGCN